MPIELIIKAPIKSSPCLRTRVMSPKVDRIKTNFYPALIHKEKRKSQGLAIYVSNSKDTSLDTFSPDVEEDVYIHQGALSYDKETRLLKVKMNAVSGKSAHGSDYIVRSFKLGQDKHNSKGSSQVGCVHEEVACRWGCY